MFKYLFGRMLNVSPPKHITNYIKANNNERQKMKYCKTKYNEWVIMTLSKSDASIIVKLINFKDGRTYKRFSMYLTLQQEKNYIQLDDIQVFDKDTGKGYGSLFINELFEIVKEFNVNGITGTLERPKDKRLKTFYKKFGFTIHDDKLTWEKIVYHYNK